MGFSLAGGLFSVVTFLVVQVWFAVCWLILCLIVTYFLNFGLDFGFRFLFGVGCVDFLVGCWLVWPAGIGGVVG